jgi:hypothetical protein
MGLRKTRKRLLSRRNRKNKSFKRSRSMLKLARRSISKRGGVKGTSTRRRDRPSESKEIYPRTEENVKLLHKGSNQRFKLVQLCKEGEWDEYEKVVQTIIREYRQKAINKGDFTYRPAFIMHLDEEIETFSEATLNCLERVLTRLQEDAIQSSQIHIDNLNRRLAALQSQRDSQ